MGLRVVLVRYSQSTRYGPDVHSHHCVEDLHELAEIQPCGVPE